MAIQKLRCSKCKREFSANVGDGVFDTAPEICPACDKKLKEAAMEQRINNPHADNDLRLSSGPSIRNISEADFRPLSTGQITTRPDPKTQIVFSSSSEFKKLTSEDLAKIGDFVTGVDLVRQFIVDHSSQGRAAVNQFVDILKKADSPFAVAGASFAAAEVADLAIKDGHSKPAAIGLGVTIGGIGLIPHVKIVAGAYDMTAYGANKLQAPVVWAYNTLISTVTEITVGQKYGASAAQVATQLFGAEQIKMLSFAETVYDTMKIAKWYVTER